ncbi:YcaO-like family protein [Amycolatopsis sp. MtRt-6]|uniref:YcaO-like family protein n=1 Tax=Amycolatopsis sp. MtRt-6 TaxID=2792782 RepID=UPI001A8C6B45|nr:YcaO-like family protein [Amycolatopsis sp. MtRt-6]
MFGRDLSARGFFLYPVSDGDWRCVTPDGILIRLRVEDQVARQAQAALAGAAGEPTGTARELLAGLARRAGQRTTASGIATRTVFVETAGPGNPVATALTTILDSHVKIVHGTPESPLPSEAGLVVSCAGWLPDAHWRELDDRCAAEGVAWHRCHVEGGRIRLGPMTVPGGLRYADVRARRLAASAAADELRLLWATLDAEPSLPEPRWPGPGSVTIAAGLLAADVLAYLEGRPVPGAAQEQEVDGVEISRHPVLPLPASPASVPAGGVERLLDCRFGIVTRVRRVPPMAGLPRAFTGYTAEIADTREFASWQADRETSGAALGDAERARRAAIGEAVERYCGNAVPPDLVTGSAAALAARGREVLDPAEFALYSPAQYASAGFPFVPFTRHLETSWTTGRDLLTGSDVLVPAALTYLNGPGNRPGEHPAIANHAFAGIAAGASAEAAEQAALEEVIERDAVTIWWYSGAPASALRMAPGDLPDSVPGDLESAGLTAGFLRIPCAFEVPVVGVFLEDRARGLVAFGSACRATPQAAAEKALCEALVTYAVGRALADPDGDFWPEVRAGRASPSPYRPWRADRGYRASFRRDWRDLTTLDPNVQLYLDPVMQGEPIRRLREPAGSTELAAVAGPPRAAYLRALGTQGLRAVSVDVTTPDVASAGLHVARVVVPGTYQLAPAAFPVLGGTRLYTVPVARGWVPGPATERDVVLHPLPFA